MTLDEAKELLNSKYGIQAKDTQVFLSQTIVFFTEDGLRKLNTLNTCADCVYFKDKTGTDRRFNLCGHELGMVSPRNDDFCSLFIGHNTLTSMNIEKED